MENLSEFRKELGLTHEKMSQILGCSRTNYTRYELGLRNFPIQYLVRLSVLYQVSADYLLGLEEKKTISKVTDDSVAFIRQWETDKPHLKRIRGLRKEKGLTQTQAADGIMCSQQAYSDYELGSRSVIAPVLVKLARFYQVSTDYILGLTDER